MRSLLLDTNLLCLLVVGQVGEDRIARHKRLNRYDVSDYRQLLMVIANFDKLVVTSHVLAECSNLIRLTPQPLRREVMEQLARIIALAQESRPSAIEIIATKDYRPLGFTDAALLYVADSDIVLLTDDLDLYLGAQRQGIMAINYAHLQEGATLSGLGFG